MARVIQPMRFDFNGEFSSPFLSAPPTPQRFGGPTSPGRWPDFDNGDLSDFSVSTSSVIPFEWEEKPGTPNLRKGNDSSFEDDFAFHVSDQTGKTTLPAEELFDGGKIKPSNPPPKQQPSSSGLISKNPERTERERGRERVASSSNKSRSRRGTTRSLSPLRVSAYPWEGEEGEEERQPLRQNSKQKGSRKWRLKDFFLFRSASEGRASEKDPIRKYRASMLKKHEDEKKSSSLRSIEGSSNSNRRAAVSAHELHYTVNRAVSEDLKKKTFLPYKQGILGRLAFNPAVHALANGFGLSRRR